MTAFTGWGAPGNGAARGWELVPMDETVLPLIAEVEQTAYSHPWGLGHFSDSLRSGYWLQMLVTPPRADDPPEWAHAPRLPDGRWLLGYLVAMPGFEEVHLLNITTVPQHRRHGCARLMMAALIAWSRLQGALALWLEVRVSNLGAMALYESLGFRRLNVRKDYYPDGGNRREDALVMSLVLDGDEPAAGVPEVSA